MIARFGRAWWREFAWLVRRTPGVREYVAFALEARTPTRLLAERPR